MHREKEAAVHRVKQVEIPAVKVYNRSVEERIMDKRYIAPVLITIAAVIYLGAMVFAFVAALLDGLPFILFLLLAIIPAGIAGGIVYMLIQRIREIQGGEEDEAGKY